MLLNVKKAFVFEPTQLLYVTKQTTRPINGSICNLSLKIWWWLADIFSPKGYNYYNIVIVAIEMFKKCPIYSLATHAELQGISQRDHLEALKFSRYVHVPESWHILAYLPW